MNCRPFLWNAAAADHKIGNNSVRSVDLRQLTFSFPPINHSAIINPCLSISAYIRVSYRGGRGGPGIPPPATLPRNLEIEYGYILAIMCHQNVWKFCPRLCQKQSERYINSRFSFGGGMPPDSPSRHACVSHTTIILLPSCSPPPTQNPV